MVFIRFPKLSRRTKYYFLFGLFVSICIYLKNHSPEMKTYQEDKNPVQLLLENKNENQLLSSRRLDGNTQRENVTKMTQQRPPPGQTKKKPTSGWLQYIAARKRNKTNAVVVQGTDIGPQILQFFELSSNEERDEFVNLHSYTFKLNTDLCKNETFLAVVIHSAPANAGKRNFIRNTFGTVKEHRGHRIVYVFVLGDVIGYDDQQKLDKESEINKDIVQGNFLDLYRHLSRKHVMAMNWFKHNCDAKYVLKLDDDTFVNPYGIVDFILDVKPTGKELWCKFADYLEPEREESKWHTSMEEYPFSVFPLFCQGFAYLATRESWSAMYDVSADNRKISMDDVFVTGILALKARVQRNDFRRILWRCKKYNVFNLTGNKNKAILYDPLNKCSKFPFEKWNKLKKIFINRSRT